MCFSAVVGGVRGSGSGSCRQGMWLWVAGVGGENRVLVFGLVGFKGLGSQEVRFSYECGGWCWF